MSEEGLEKARAECAERHREQQGQLERVVAGHAELREDFYEFRGRLLPYLDNGQPGLFSRLTDKLDEAVGEITQLRIELGVDDGRRDAYRMVRAVIGPLIVGLVLVLAQHLWK